jgi:5-methylcytosine-specific restriction protein A
MDWIMPRADYAHLYKTAQWQRLRTEQLRRAPMCQCPHCQGRRLVATVVDHKTPHKGDKTLFFDRSNLQSMNKECHDRFKQSQEAGGAGFLQGCDEHGWPLSREHHWHASNT